MGQQPHFAASVSGGWVGSLTRLTLIQRASIVIWGYSVAVWLYVIAMQLRYPNSVTWPLAVWVPIRLDYLGEAAFVLSFAFAMITALVSVVKRRVSDLVPDMGFVRRES